MLFENVYDWAGEIRKINIYKEEPVLAGLSVQYEDYNKIKRSITNLNKKFLNTQWEELSKTEIVDNIVRFFSSLWRIHPFREGNTRSVSTLMFLFIRNMNLKLNQDFIKEHAKYFRNALVLASIGEYSEYEHITNFLKDAISYKTIDSAKYKTIKNYEVDKYQYNYHSYKKDWRLNKRTNLFEMNIWNQIQIANIQFKGTKKKYIVNQQSRIQISLLVILPILPILNLKVMLLIFIHGADINSLLVSSARLLLVLNLWWMKVGENDGL